MAVVSDDSQFSIYEFRVNFFKGSVLGFEEGLLLFYDVNVLYDNHWSSSVLLQQLHFKLLCSFSFLKLHQNNGR